MARTRRAALRTFLTRLLIAVLVTGVLSVGLVVGVNRGIDDRVASIKRVRLAVAPAPAQGANFLIIGSDTRAFVDNSGDANAFGSAQNEGGQRSDTLMVVHIEPGAQRALVVSFPRDLMVDVPGISGKSRINAAYSIGGPQAVIDTLRDNFGIDINHYLEVDFKSFQAVIQAIGKVSIYLPGELRDDSSDGGSGFHSVYGAGCYALSGGAALAYVRSRHMQIADPEGPIVDENGKHWRLLDIRSDLDRIQRQQTFVRKLAGVAIQRSLGNPFTAIELADNVLGYITADQNLSRSDVNELVRAFRTVNVNDANSVEFQTIPVLPDPNNPNVTLVPAPDADALIARLRTFGDDTPKPPAVAPSQIKVLVRDGAAGGNAPGVASALAGQGFVSLGAGASVTPAVATSEIRYGANMADAAKTLLDYIPDAALVHDSKLDGKTHVELVLGSTFSTVTVPSTTTTTTVPGAPVTSAPPTTTEPPTTTTTIPPDPCPN